MLNYAAVRLDAVSVVPLGDVYDAHVLDPIPLGRVLIVILLAMALALTLHHSN